MKKKLLTIAITGVLAASAYVYADSDKHKGFFNFNTIGESANKADWDPTAPWKLPKGYHQTLVSGEDALNIYDGGRDDWHDMNTVNESGADAGRYMYRTHELRYPDNQPEGGAISVVDLKTGKTTLLASDPDWDALDGIRWTPWGTLLFAEEKTGGRLFEIELNDDMVSVKAVHDRPAVGRLAHEGIDLDAAGNIYIVDEHRGRTEEREEKGNTCAGALPCGGGIYKFVPDNYGDLSSGNLYVLGIDENTRRDGTGQGVWLGPIDAENARAAGTAAGGQSYQRPEDLEIIDNKIYAAITEGPRDEYGNEYYEGRVIAIDMKNMNVSDFVKAGVNVAVEMGIPGDEDHQSGFDSVDNLAESPDGRLIMIEDNKPSDIWFASTHTDEYGASRDVKLFASLTDPGAEGTGIYISPTDLKTLYVNIQHSEAEDGDGTWAISRKGGRQDRD